MKSKLKYRIVQDTDPQDPCKEFDFAGKMVCWHRRYNLGHEQPGESIQEFLANLAGLDHESKIKIGSRFYTVETVVNIDHKYNMEALLEKAEKNHVILPLYLYDHSGITISTAPFSCGWDSGQVGFVYISKEDGIKEWGKRWRAKAEKCLKAEVGIYDKYLTGEVYGYVVYKEKKGRIVEDHIDSCWGFYGYEDAEEQAKEAIEYIKAERKREKENEKLQAKLCSEIMHV